MKQITLTQGQVAIVDDTDYEWLSQWKWSAHWRPKLKSFYAVRTSARVDGKHTIYMHRELLGLARGDKRQGDHVNGDTLDNHRENLRFATHAENMHNQRISRNNTSGYKGVFWNQGRRKWRAQIYIDNHQQYLGCFDTPEAAAGAYDFAAIALHGEFANINVAKEVQP